MNLGKAICTVICQKHSQYFTYFYVIMNIVKPIPIPIPVPRSKDFVIFSQSNMLKWCIMNV